MHDAMTTGKKLTRDKFVEQMTELQGDNDFKCDKMVIDVPGDDLRGFLDILRNAIRVRTVEVLDNCAALAGIYVSPDAKCPVFVLVKERGTSSASVEIKSTASQEIISSLFTAVTEAMSSDSGRSSAAAPSLLSSFPSEQIPDKKPKKERSGKSKKDKRDKKSTHEPPKEEKREKEKKPKKEPKVEAKPAKKDDDLSFLDM